MGGGKGEGYGRGEVVAAEVRNWQIRQVNRDGETGCMVEGVRAEGVTEGEIGEFKNDCYTLTASSLFLPY